MLNFISWIASSGENSLCLRYIINWYSESITRNIKTTTNGVMFDTKTFFNKRFSSIFWIKQSKEMSSSEMKDILFWNLKNVLKSCVHPRSNTERIATCWKWVRSCFKRIPISKLVFRVVVENLIWRKMYEMKNIIVIRSFR